MRIHSINLLLQISVISLLFYSCGKEEIVEIKKNKGEENHQIKIGYQKNMQQSSFTQLFGVDLNSNETILKKVDVNFDGVYDIGIEMNSVYSDSWGQRVNSYIFSLHPDAYIRAIEQTDTLFKSSDTSSSKITNTYSCFRMDPNDLVLGVQKNQKKIFPINEGMMMDESNFLTGRIKFYSTSYKEPDFYSSPYTYSTYRNNNCNLLTLGRSYYLGMKIIEDDGSVKLGWIKIGQIMNHVISYDGQAMEL